MIALLQRCPAWLAILVLISQAGCSAPLSPQTRTMLFDSKALGYTKCRIPGITVTKAGTLIAWCEARTAKAGDWDPSDLFIRRSEDDGKTWSPPTKIAGDGKQPFNNPVMIADRETGTIELFYCTNYERCFHLRSFDDGKSFVGLEEITHVFDVLKPQWDWKVVATGPNHGIQLRNGRLLTPVWLSTTAHRHQPNSVTTLYSDDHGATWKVGDLAIKNSPTIPSPNETVAVELSDGRVMLNTRQGNYEHRRAVVIGTDGATGWGEPHFDEALVEPRNNAAIVRYSFPSGDKPGILLFANPHNITEPMKGKKQEPGGTYEMYARKNVSIQLSYDDGKTWPLIKTIEPGSSGYSDLAVDDTGMIYSIFEQTTNVVVSRFALSAITGKRE